MEFRFDKTTRKTNLLFCPMAKEKELKDDEAPNEVKSKKPLQRKRRSGKKSLERKNSEEKGCEGKGCEGKGIKPYRGRTRGY